MAFPMMALAAGATINSAAAQTACGPYENITAALEAKYGEQRRASGLDAAPNLVEIWASPEGGTWTILIIYPDGRTCVAAAGEAWIEDQIRPVGQPS